MTGATSPATAQPQTQDASLLVSQNNQKRTVKVVEISVQAAELLGYVHQEIEGLPLQTILSDATKETLEELLEFDDAAEDLDDVIKRIHHFRLKRYNGEEVPVAIKIFRESVRDQNQWFRLLVKDERRQIAEKSITSALREHFEGVRSVDAETGLPERNSCARYFEMVQNYGKSHELKACFAVLRIDRHEKNMARYGKSGCLQLLQHVAACCRGSFREEDIVCQLSESSIGLFLLNIELESARVVLNRLRWNIRNHRIDFGGKSDFSNTVSIVFAPVHAHLDDDLLSACEQSSAAIELEERNLLIEYKGE